MKYHPLLRIVLLLLAALSLGGCAGMYFKDAGVPAPAEPRDPAHWPYREYWTGIVFNGAKIGFARLTLAPPADAPGRYDIDSEAVFALRFLGLEKKFMLKTHDRVHADLTLASFDYDLVMVGNRQQLTGTVTGHTVTATVCDADLVNLRKEHLDQLIHRYCEGFDMVIMDKGSQPWVFRSLLQSVPAVSGTRIFGREHFYKIPFRKTDRFQFENRINDHFFDNSLTIAVSPAEEIHDTRKFIKYPFWKGLFLDLRGGLDILLANGLLGIFRNLRTFRRIRRLAYTPDGTKVPRR